jgi:hypothetical protein
MGNVIFKCPNTGLNVQHWLDDNEPENPSPAYETVVCQGCNRLHFINRSNGKLLGQPVE